MISAIPRSLDEMLATRQVALVVYDMQVGILRQIEGGDRVIASVMRLLTAARSVSMPTFFTKHMSLPRELMGRFQLRQAMAWQRVDDPEKVHPWFLRGCEGVELVPEVAPLASEAIVEKIAMSAFEGTYLGMALRDLDINAFIIAGVALEIGIEPTVRHGTDLGFIPIVATDACGAGNAQAAERSLEGLRFTGDALLSTVEKIRAAIPSNP